MYFIGIDLGTSACKLLLVADGVGSILNDGHEGISPHLPAPRLVGAEARGLVGAQL